MFGGAGLNTMVKTAFDFDGCREAYLVSLQRLKQETVDVFIGNHTWNNDTYGKGRRLLAGGENEFIDSSLWPKFLACYEERLLKIISEDP